MIYPGTCRALATAIMLHIRSASQQRMTPIDFYTNREVCEKRRTCVTHYESIIFIDFFTATSQGALYKRARQHLDLRTFYTRVHAGSEWICEWESHCRRRLFLQSCPFKPLCPSQSSTMASSNNALERWPPLILALLCAFFLFCFRAASYSFWKLRAAL